MADLYNVPIVNQSAAPLPSQIRQNRGYVGYFKQGQTIIGDELIQSAKLIQSRNTTKKYILEPKGGPKRLAIELVDSTEVGVDVTTLQKSDEWKAVFAGGAANQWKADNTNHTITDIGRAIAGGANGMYVLVEAYDRTEGTIYVFPFTTLTKTDTPDVDGLPGTAYQVRVAASTNGWQIPASLKSATAVLDDTGVTVGIAIDTLLVDVPSVLHDVLGYQ